MSKVSSPKNRDKKITQSLLAADKPELSSWALPVPGRGVVSRIIEYLSFKDISKRQFYIKTGLSNGFLDKGENIGSDKLWRIVCSYQDINLFWLITGKGEKLHHDGTALFRGIDEKKMEAFENTNVISSRLLNFLNTRGISKRQFSLKTGLSIGFLDKGGNIGSNNVEKILNSYPELNIYWLIIGEGEMIDTTHLSLEGSKNGGWNSLVVDIISLEMHVLILQKIVMPTEAKERTSDKQALQSIESLQADVKKLPERVASIQKQMQILFENAFIPEPKKKKRFSGLTDILSKIEIHDRMGYDDLELWTLALTALIETFIKVLAERKLKVN